MLKMKVHEQKAILKFVKKKVQVETWNKEQTALHCTEFVIKLYSECKDFFYDECMRMCVMWVW